MRNPYMKFQDDISMPYTYTHTHTHTHTHTQAKTDNVVILHVSVASQFSLTNSQGSENKDSLR